MISLTVNGGVRRVDADGDTPLLWILRDELGLKGTKFGCGVAQCGACTVHMDGQAVRSCCLPVSRISGAITTIEGVFGPEAEAIKAAWIALDVPQCGYCQPGQIMSAIGLLSELPEPDDRDIDRAMSGNICRCATYVRIRAAIHAAATALKPKD